MMKHIIGVCATAILLAAMLAGCIEPPVTTGAPTDAGDYLAEITLSGVKTSEGDDISGLVLFSDYIFAQREIEEGERNEQAVSFSMTITFDNNENITRTIDFDTQIPITRNYLTTIIGNCLTQKESFVFDIDDTLLAGEEITY